MAEAQIRDQLGNPIPLTDQFGNPVKLTDENGNPVVLTGVATTLTGTVPDLLPTQARNNETDLARSSSTTSTSSSSSSSSSSEDDEEQHAEITTASHPTVTTISHPEPEKKGLLEKIKEKLPGHLNQ
ncbi:late embryogenesis abundant protein [Cajanus cajan]|uniref:Late embryogenesis abundant protein n=1 Tax=Cajanus cajan TaxID=3821 RepID=A0A151R986_CAJCA|nr:late embryogenesis abundant protein [Cajanus cajan]KYP39194.1 hypothetical protein KK1_039527 [Cajanus cajan]